MESSAGNDGLSAAASDERKGLDGQGRVHAPRLPRCGPGLPGDPQVHPHTRRVHSALLGAVSDPSRFDATSPRSCCYVASTCARVACPPHARGCTLRSTVGFHGSASFAQQASHHRKPRVRGVLVCLRTVCSIQSGTPVVAELEAVSRVIDKFCLLLTARSELPVQEPACTSHMGLLGCALF